MCEDCLNYVYEEETGENYCMVLSLMDEDDYSRLISKERKICSYYRLGNEYTIVKKQN
jgi:hypothetical protein